jgi:hypothetical protein
MILLDTKKYSVNQSIDKKKIYTLQDKGNNSKERQLIYNTSKWHKLRQYKLASNPICEICNGQY